MREGGREGKKGGSEGGREGREGGWYTYGTASACGRPEM